MTASLHVRTRRATWIALSLTILVPGCADLGCANPRPPRPPSLHLPQIVTDLMAERHGDAVLLRWTTPVKTTDDLNIKGMTTAELCRGDDPTSGCFRVYQATVQPGQSMVVDQLPPVLRSEQQRLIRYQVRLLNSQERSAGYGTPVFVAAGSAPPPVTGLAVRGTAQGALLQWKPEDAADAIELTRLHSALPAAPRTPGRSRLAAERNEPAELHLLASKAGTTDAPFRGDAGGALDQTAHRGETYLYTAQRVRKVALGGHALELRSATSSEVSITMHDLFPPKPPAGLETIATQQADRAGVDLSWRPNVEPDLAGYLVYRQELDAAGADRGAPEKLTPTPIQEPGFRDAHASTGHTYRYTVTAVDESGNESAPGPPAREELRLP